MAPDLMHRIARDCGWERLVAHLDAGVSGGVDPARRRERDSRALAEPRLSGHQQAPGRQPLQQTSRLGRSGDGRSLHASRITRPAERQRLLSHRSDRPRPRPRLILSSPKRSRGLAEAMGQRERAGRRDRMIAPRRNPIAPVWSTRSARRECRSGCVRRALASSIGVFRPAERELLSRPSWRASRQGAASVCTAAVHQVRSVQARRPRQPART
jgi:hypothetical protein